MVGHAAASAHVLPAHTLVWMIGTSLRSAGIIVWVASSTQRARLVGSAARRAKSSGGKVPKKGFAATALNSFGLPA
jgi:hypothetical protein